jgi:hypothetical protein
MKKRLPTLVVFGGALLAGLFIFLWPYLFPPQKALDSDKDGYPDKIDKCPKEFSKTNNGCPEKEAKKGDDQDGDGYFAGFQKDASLQDNDDNDPCSPNINCMLCDEDDDKLTREEEIKKGSNPKLKDSDADGVNDFFDVCANTPGFTEKKGCPIKLNVNLSKSKNTIYWNAEITKYAINLELDIISLNYTLDVTGQSQISLNLKNIAGYTRGIEYPVKLKITFRDPDKINITDSEMKAFVL